MNKSRSDKGESVEKEYYLAKIDDYRNRRIGGFLHPKCYLWVIEKAFDGGLKDIPSKLLELYGGACGAWGWRPHLRRLERWERERFGALLDLLYGDSWKDPQEASEGTGEKEP